MTTLSPTSLLFADIQDADAQLMQGGQSGNYFNAKVSNTCIKVCFGLVQPTFSVSGQVKIKLTPPA